MVYLGFVGRRDRQSGVTTVPTARFAMVQVELYQVSPDGQSRQHLTTMAEVATALQALFGIVRPFEDIAADFGIWSVEFPIEDVRLLQADGFLNVEAGSYHLVAEWPS